MNQHDWIRLLTPLEQRILGWALADQDRLLDRQGEAGYYGNVLSTTAEMVEAERVRQEIVEKLTQHA